MDSKSPENSKGGMVAFVFPGQGSQAPGMGNAWTSHPSWELVAEASDIAGRDVEYLLCHADADELRQTRNSQLSTFVMSMVALDAVSRTGVEPALHAGHSLGEYSALTASGALSFEDAVHLVTERGNAMQAAADEQVGTMAAVLGLSDEKAELACAQTAGDVWVANFNAPGQVIIAGDPESIEAAGVNAKGFGAKRVMPIKVGGAFHTPFMSPARDRLLKAIKEAEIRDPNRPVYANVDALAHTDGNDWSNLMAAQLTSPVRWRQTLLAMSDAGVTHFLELGPGNVLTGLIKRTLKGATRSTVTNPDDLDSFLLAIAKTEEPIVVNEGETLYAVERLVVSPSTGVFQPVPGLENGSTVEAGQIIGTVGSENVRSAFSGSMEGMLALPGERVTTSQPIAWLRSV